MENGLKGRRKEERKRKKKDCQMVRNEETKKDALERTSLNGYDE